MMILTGANSQLVYQSALTVRVLSGGPVSRDISVAVPSTGWFPVSRYFWSEWEVGEGNENLVYLPPWDFFYMP
jgi:hypothetical protein